MSPLPHLIIEASGAVTMGLESDPAGREVLGAFATIERACEARANAGRLWKGFLVQSLARRLGAATGRQMDALARAADPEILAAAMALRAQARSF